MSLGRRDTGRPGTFRKVRDPCPHCQRDVAWWEWLNRPYRHNMPNGKRCPFP